MKPKKIEIDDFTIKRIAVRRAKNVSVRDLEAEFQIGRALIVRVLDTELARQTIIDVLRDDITLENAYTRRLASELGPLALEVLKKKLQEGDLRAVEPALRASGIYVQNSKETDKDPKNATITVILPGEAKKEIEVENVSTDT